MAELEVTTSHRGGVRRGAGRKREESTIKIRFRSSVHKRWVETRDLRGDKDNNKFAEYLLDLAAHSDECAIPRYCRLITPHSLDEFIMCSSCAPITSTPCKQTTSRRPQLSGILSANKNPNTYFIMVL